MVHIGVRAVMDSVRLTAIRVFAELLKKMSPLSLQMGQRSEHTILPNKMNLMLYYLRIESSRWIIMLNRKLYSGPTAMIKQ